MNYNSNKNYIVTLQCKLYNILRECFSVLYRFYQCAIYHHSYIPFPELNFMHPLKIHDIKPHSYQIQAYTQEAYLKKEI